MGCQESNHEQPAASQIHWNLVHQCASWEPWQFHVEDTPPARSNGPMSEVLHRTFCRLQSPCSRIPLRQLRGMVCGIEMARSVATGCHRDILQDSFNPKYCDYSHFSRALETHAWIHFNATNAHFMNLRDQIYPEVYW
jgi:hypothetical protein